MARIDALPPTFPLFHATYCDPSVGLLYSLTQDVCQQEGGWTRQTTVRELPTSSELASVNMRLGEGVIRELHWHKEAEWAYILDGSVRVTALDYDGGNFIDDLEKGDLWYFPSGVPHSLQGLSPNGTEFLLIFDDGRFSEESTFILTDWLGMLAIIHPLEAENCP